MSHSAASTLQVTPINEEFVSSVVHGWTPRGSLFIPDSNIWWLGGGAGAFHAFPQGPDRVRMFLTGRDKTIRTRIGIVTLSWSETPQVIDVTPDPVFDLGELGCFDMDGVSYPWIVERDGALFMYYVSWTRMGGEIPFRNQMGLAISTDDGKSFKRISRAPLLPQTDAEPIGTGSMCVEAVPGGWRMFYTSFLRWEREDNGVKHYYHIREAYSQDGIHWERGGKVVVDLIAPHEYALGAPDIDTRLGRKVLYFTARGEKYRLFVSAEQEDGSWQRLPRPLEIPRSGFDADMQCYPRSLRFGDKSYLLYSGDGYGRAGIGYAEWTGA